MRKPQAYDHKTGRFMSFRAGKHSDLYRGIDARRPGAWENGTDDSPRIQARLDFDAEIAFNTMRNVWAA